MPDFLYLHIFELFAFPALSMYYSEREIQSLANDVFVMVRICPSCCGKLIDLTKYFKPFVNATEIAALDSFQLLACY